MCGRRHGDDVYRSPEQEQETGFSRVGIGRRVAARDADGVRGGGEEGEEEEDGRGETAWRFYLDGAERAMRKALSFFSVSLGSDAGVLAEIRSVLRDVQHVRAEGWGH